MSVVNRCAISLEPRKPMLEWTRAFRGEAGPEPLDNENSIYLIAPYDDEAEGMRRLEERFDEIFSTELILWCEDRSEWPQPRSFQLFTEWFRIRFHPLVEDLGEDPLRRYQTEEAFNAQVRDALV